MKSLFKFLLFIIHVIGYILTLTILSILFIPYRYPYELMQEVYNVLVFLSGTGAISILGYLGYLIGKYNLIDVLVKAAIVIQRHRDIENARVFDVFGDEIGK